MSLTCNRSVVFSNNKTDRHHITEILLKVELNTINQTIIVLKSPLVKLLIAQHYLVILFTRLGAQNHMFMVFRHLSHLYVLTAVVSKVNNLFCIQLEINYKPIDMTFNAWGHSIFKRIGGVMVSVLAPSVVDRGFEPRSGQTKDYKIGIWCFPAKHASFKL